MTRTEPRTYGNPAGSAGPRLWSLWDMINYSVANTLSVLQLLQQQESLIRGISRTGSSGNIASSGLLSAGIIATARKGNALRDIAGLGNASSPTPVFGIAEPLKGQTKTVLAYVERECELLELDAALDRVTRARNVLESPVGEYGALADELKVLRETIEDGLKNRHFYYYPVAKATAVFGAKDEWALALAAFKKTGAKDIWAAIDCYALGYNTACVFHLMRVAEYGLRALARERRIRLPHKKLVEWQDWHTIIEAIRTDVQKKFSNKPRGPVRDAALGFYQGALGHFESFKDVYRNNVMHVRMDYDDASARSVLNQVRDFMCVLSTRINEDTKRAVKWGAK